MSLVELQKFLADELEEAGGESHFGRAFRPLTDGLGLAGNAKKEAAPVPKAPTPKPAAPAPRPSARVPVPDATKFFDSFPTETSPPLVPERPRVEARREEVVPRPVPVVPAIPVIKEIPQRSVFAERKADRAADVARALQETEEETKTLPPPVPQASFFRRLLAGMIDQAFVLSLLAVVLLITSAVLSKEGGVLSRGLLTNLKHPAYIRFAILGFATLWMSYLVLGVGILDMTFGMWVWGLRISYTTQSGDSHFARKLMRVLTSFCFEALLFPSVLLVIRVKGRNLVDWLSGSYLYRTA